MGHERDATYKPLLLVNPLQYTVSWNDEGEESWLSLLKNHEKVKKYVDEDQLWKVKYELTTDLLIEVKIHFVSQHLSDDSNKFAGTMPQGIVLDAVKPCPLRMAMLIFIAIFRKNGSVLLISVGQDTSFLRKSWL